MPDNSIIQTSELPDLFVEGAVMCQAATANLVLFVADRDYWVQQIWTSGPTESDSETYKFIKVKSGNAVNATGSAIDSVSDAVEIHSSNTSWAGANVRHDFTVLTDKASDGIEAHHLQAGDVLICRASTAMVLNAIVGFRLYSRRQ